MKYFCPEKPKNRQLTTKLQKGYFTLKLSSLFYNGSKNTSFNFFLQVENCIRQKSRRAYYLHSLG